jgi:hypothetical protein
MVTRSSPRASTPRRSRCSSAPTPSPPHPNLDFNLAQTLDLLARPVEALEHYERYVRESPTDDSPQQKLIGYTRITELRRALATVDVRVNVDGATIAFDGRSLGTSPLHSAVRVVPGSHTLVVSRAGYQQQLVELALQRGQHVTRDIVLVTVGEGTPPTAPSK